MRISDFTTLSFDCYGTLIDWERGLLAELRPWLARQGKTPSDDEVLEVYADCEFECQQETPKAPYPVILARVHDMIANHYHISSEEAERDAFAASIGVWPPFADAAEALRYFKHNRFRLVVLSNVDNASLSKSIKALDANFDAIYTAETIGSYKPNLNNFRYLMDRLRNDFGVVSAQHLHVAQSLFHDHIPAKELGLQTCWIDRRGDEKGGGATKVPAIYIHPDFHFSSLEALVAAHRKEQS